MYFFFKCFILHLKKFYIYIPIRCILSLSVLFCTWRNSTYISFYWCTLFQFLFPIICVFLLSLFPSVGYFGEESIRSNNIIGVFHTYKTIELLGSYPFFARLRYPILRMLSFSFSKRRLQDRHADSGFFNLLFRKTYMEALI